MALKGKENNFAALSSSGELYVWGSTAKKLISKDLLLPATWKGNYLFEPVLQTEFVGCHIHDFSIDTGFLMVIAGRAGGDRATNELYWNSLRDKARRQLDYYKKLRLTTESEEVQNIKKKYKNSILNYRGATTDRRKKETMDKVGSLENHTSTQRYRKKISEREMFIERCVFKKTAPLTS